MRYPIAIESGDAGHAYGVVVPDLPGCFSAGDTLDEALTNAQEAILLHIEGLLGSLGCARSGDPSRSNHLEKLPSIHGDLPG